MIHAVSWSGGKDSMLALDRAVRERLHVRFLFNIYEGNTNRVRFHGVRRELIAAQAEALGGAEGLGPRLELVQEATHPSDYETAFARALDRLAARGVAGIVFGNIHLADIRAWYEERTGRRGLAHVEPLWGAEPRVLLAELLDRGYRARVVSVSLELADPRWLGRVLDPVLAAELDAAGGDTAGERGEYHTFVFDGPLFRHPVAVDAGPTFETEGHRILDLLRR